LRPFLSESGNCAAVLLGELRYFDLPKSFYFSCRYLPDFSILGFLKNGVDAKFREAFGEAEELSREFAGDPCLVFTKKGAPVLVALKASPLFCHRFVAVDEYQIIEFRHFLGFLFQA